MLKINGELLFSKIEQSGLSYTKLAKKTQICRGTLHNVIYGINKPSHQVAYQLAKALLMSEREIVEIFFPNINFEQEINYE